MMTKRSPATDNPDSDNGDQSQHEQTVAELRKSVQLLTSDLEPTSARLVATEEKLRQAEKRIEQMESSRSWKYTTLLRRLNGTEDA